MRLKRARASVQAMSTRNTKAASFLSFLNPVLKDWLRKALSIPSRNASQTKKQIYDCHKRATAAGGIAEPYNLAQKRLISTGLEERLQ